jgi:hypothetical protein
MSAPGGLVGAVVEVEAETREEVEGAGEDAVCAVAKEEEKEKEVGAGVGAWVDILSPRWRARLVPWGWMVDVDAEVGEADTGGLLSVLASSILMIMS